MRTDFETSIRSDAFALQSLKHYQDGKLIMYSWLSRGLVKPQDLASWRFDGDESAVADIMKRTPGAMRELLSLTSLPDVGDEREKQLVEQAGETLLPGRA